MWPFSSPYPQVPPELVGRPLHPFESNTVGDEYTYDYIIVGGGTAGCVLASRLSENPDISVLVLECGPIADTWANSVPLISGSLRPDTLAKKFMSAPFVHDQREVIMVRAEGLGGGSRINGMLYNRGVPGDYNRWRDMGHPEWSYEKLLPYFIKSETSLSHPKSPARGKSGPWINQKYPNSICHSIDVAKAAAYNLGMPEVVDFNDPSAPPIGTWDVDTLQYPNRKRCSVFHAFLPHAVAEARAAHLKICTETLVQRIVFEKGPDGRPRAVGVEFRNADPKRKGKVFLARVRKEVIVCSGAIGSPQVLMLSGIGPAEHLRSHGIDVVFDNPGVGSHFKDHPGVPLIWGTPVDDSFRILLAKPWRVALSLAQYLLTGGGIMSSPWASVAIFLPSKHISPTGHVVADPNPGTNAASLADLSLADPANVPDIEILPIPVDTVDPRADFSVPAGAFSLLITLLNPRSTGTVRLRSGDPADAPVCDIGLVREEGDFGALRKAVRLGMRMAGEMGRLGYVFVGREGEDTSGGVSGGSGDPEEEEVGRTGALLIPANTSDAAIDAFIRENARSTYHYSSSCRMAPFEDPAAPEVVDSELWVPGVVDDELRVHGVRGVRVCDTSAVPDIVAAHPMAVAVAMAEKCADMILRGL